MDSSYCTDWRVVYEQVQIKDSDSIYRGVSPTDGGAGPSGSQAQATVAGVCCTAWSIHRWFNQAERDAGQGDGGLTTNERQELAQLRRENRQLKVEREILSNVWSAP